MRWKSAFWTVAVLTALWSAPLTGAKSKPKAQDSNKDLFILHDAQNDGSTDDPVGSGSGSKTDQDNASGIGPDDEDATPEGSGVQPVVETSTPSRQLTPCQQLRLTAPNFKNTFIAQCTDTGKFKKRQCRGDDTCWCVDPNGGQIMGTSKIGDMTNALERPDCEGGSNLTPCITLLVKNEWGGLLGSLKPRCTPDGKFEPMQCHERECWCVDDLGRVIDGSAKMTPNVPNCDEDVRRLKAITKRPITHKHPTTDPDISLVEHGRKPDGGTYHVPGVGQEGDSMDIDADNEHSASEPREGKTHHGLNTQEDYGGTPIPLIEQPGILAGIIGGAVVGLLCTILLIMFIVYRVRKKDEGSYALDEPTKARGAYAYQKAPEKEFYA